MGYIFNKLIPIVEIFRLTQYREQVHLIYHLKKEVNKISVIDI